MPYSPETVSFVTPCESAVNVTKAAPTSCDRSTSGVSRIGPGFFWAIVCMSCLATAYKTKRMRRRNHESASWIHDASNTTETKS